MKKRLLIFSLPLLLCGCSRSITFDQARMMLDRFETNVNQMITFSYFQKKQVSTTKNTKITVFYQVFFDKNYIHYYTVNEDNEERINSYVHETWQYVKDNSIFLVKNDLSLEHYSNGKSYTKTEFDLELWQETLKQEVGNVKDTNLTYINRARDYLEDTDTKMKITTESKDEDHLLEKVELLNDQSTVVRSKSYTFNDSLLSIVEEFDENSTTEIKYVYSVTTQQLLYPDI